MLASTQYHPNFVWLSFENFKRDYSSLSLESTEHMINDRLLSCVLYYSNTNKKDHYFEEAHKLMNIL